MFRMTPVDYMNKWLFSRPEVIAAFGNTFTDFADAPVYPNSEIPEATEPYIVFKYRLSPGGVAEAWWIQDFMATYYMFGKDIGQLNEIGQAMADYIRRMDDSAYELNQYCKSEGLDDFRFHFTEFAGLFDPWGPEQEGGVYRNIMSVKGQYLNQQGRGLV